MYHNCETDESEFTRGLGTNTPPDAFREHLRFLDKHYNVVSLRTLVEGEIPPRSVAITFDDGYASAVENAVPALLGYDYPATFFLVSAVVGNAKLIWLNELMWALNTYGDEAMTILREAVNGQENEDEWQLLQRATLLGDNRAHELLTWVRKRGGYDHQALAESSGLYVTNPDLEYLASIGMECGYHTSEHLRLSTLTEDEIVEQLEMGRRFLAETPGNVGAIATPYGEHNSIVDQHASQFGFDCVVNVGAGSMVKGRRLSRVNVSTIPASHLFAELELVCPLKSAAVATMDRIRPIAAFLLLRRPRHSTDR